jgi:hypothetical protein
MLPLVLGGGLDYASSRRAGYEYVGPTSVQMGQKSFAAKQEQEEKCACGMYSTLHSIF